MSKNATPAHAGADSAAVVPVSLRERYRPEECATFVPLLRSGDVCLWQSTRIRASGEPHSQYHVTVGDEAECLFVVDMLNALLYFLDAERPQASRPDAFDDSRIFVVGSASRRGPPEEHGRITLWQADHSPTFIIVGKDCQDDYIKGVWEERTQFPEIRLCDLLAARDGGLIELSRRVSEARPTLAGEAGCVG